MLGAKYFAGEFFALFCFRRYEYLAKIGIHCRLSFYICKIYNCNYTVHVYLFVKKIFHRVDFCHWRRSLKNFSQRKFPIYGTLIQQYETERHPTKMIRSRSNSRFPHEKIKIRLESITQNESPVRISIHVQLDPH